MGKRDDIRTLLIIGSGPIVIGQACEFDYSGNQALRILRELGYRTVLVNPNPATVMTTPGIADSIYFEPLKPEFIVDILRKERPDAVLPTMGGQSALNLVLELDERGILREFNVEVIGASIRSIRLAEDRGEFKRVIESIGLENPRSHLVGSVEEAEPIFDTLGVPIVIRPSFTLGGKGGGIAESRLEAREGLTRALAESPVHTALVEESLVGWKEFELEVMRDVADNAVVVCSIENLDPMGVHTGDSITVAPAQTLSDREYQRMRTAALEIMRAVGVDCGGSNVQFALNPEDGRLIVIEMNPRVSRSSALASKATGFPIARCSAQLAVGFTLDEVINDITEKTVSSFEPTLDYVAVKVPRFETEKFPRGYDSLGTQMKSVGEALALGRTVPEALNKAIRAGEFGFDGLQELDLSDDELYHMVETLHPRRIFALYSLIFRYGVKDQTGEGSSVDADPTVDLDLLKDLQRRSAYDIWFLHQLGEVALMEHRLIRFDESVAGLADEVSRDTKRKADLILAAKRTGLSDGRIAKWLAPASMDSEETVRRFRQENGINSTYHFVDTCAGEFSAETPYFYSTWGEEQETRASGESAVVIIGSGPNRIGQGLEFDTCCTLAALAYRSIGVPTIMINNNPETVSTDFNVADRLYLEPLTEEHVSEVLGAERAKRVVVQLGGQTPLNMVENLTGAQVIGTPIEAINTVEDRSRFSAIIEELGLRQPKNRIAENRDDVLDSALEIGYPVLVRPSYVLGGRSMMIAYGPETIERFIDEAVEITSSRPVLVDEFLEDAFEYDLDAVSDGKNVYIGGIMQHIEAAGIHSGDSACVFPPYKSDHIREREMVEVAAIIARRIGIVGFLNIQFAVKDDKLYALEVNPRASRTVPFLSKNSGVNLVESAVRIWSGQDLVMQGLVSRSEGGMGGIAVGRCITGWAVKEAMFSFDRFQDTDPVLGPEMRSTGESVGIGASFGEAFAKASISAGTRLPREGRIFVSVHAADRPTILPIIRRFKEMGFSIAATRGTASFLFEHGILSEVVLKVHEGRPNIVDHLRLGKMDLLINTPLGPHTQRDDAILRIEAVRHNVPYTTTTSAAQAAAEAIRYLRSGDPVARRLPEGRTLEST